jgi:hypothetical protein
MASASRSGENRLRTSGGSDQGDVPRRDVLSVQAAMLVGAALLLLTAPARGEPPPLDDDPRSPADPAMPTPAADTAAPAQSPASSQPSKLGLTLPPPLNGGDPVPWPHYDQGFVLVPTMEPRR